MYYIIIEKQDEKKRTGAQNTSGHPSTRCQKHKLVPSAIASPESYYYIIDKSCKRYS